MKHAIPTLRHRNSNFVEQVYTDVPTSRVDLTIGFLLLFAIVAPLIYGCRVDADCWDQGCDSFLTFLPFRCFLVRGLGYVVADARCMINIYALI